MEKTSLDVTIREGKGKGFARSLRRSGRIPAILYSKGGSTPVSLDPAKVRKLLLLGHAESTLIDIKIEGVRETVAPLLGEAIRNTHNETSVSSLFV